jgi:signal transduction histidine kinase
MRKRINRPWPAYVLALVIAVSIIGVGLIFFLQARSVMRQEIRNRLSTTAAAAAINIDGDMLDRIRVPRDAETLEYRYVLATLGKIRSLPDIRFAYILRRTDDPNVLAFVADANAALSEQQLDVNGNKHVDSNEEASYPGEIYDISNVRALKKEAFMRPTADQEITYDQWGALVSGYAPIYRKNGSISAVLGIGMRADDFQRDSQTVFSPFVLFFVFGIAVIFATYIALQWERRQVNALRRINSERSGLLRLTFHQIGEPLTIMKWSLETLREQTENSQLKALVDDHILCMDEGLGRLNSIIDTLQLAEKVDLDTLEYLPKPGSLRSVIDNTVNEWQSSLKKHHQTLTVDMKEDITLPMDQSLLSLVLRQLVVNAIEYSDEGGAITVVVRRQARSVLITVHDNGCGIPPQDMQNLFEKYRRASNAHLKKPDGNGLGLYIAKGIIEKAGGKIRVDSWLGKGTAVSFFLPLEQR